jgi:hypothetical protein
MGNVCVDGHPIKEYRSWYTIGGANRFEHGSRPNRDATKPSDSIDFFFEDDDEDGD